jgi:hypothetical protein
MSNHPLEGGRSTPEEKQLIKRMVERKNMKKAYDHVIRNKGAAGIDNMPVESLKTYLQEKWPKIKGQLVKGEYKPRPVRRVEIPKPGGGRRLLGIPTVLDRLIQQAIYQILSPIFEPTFSDSSYGFRPKRNAHQAVQDVAEHLLKGKTTERYSATPTEVVIQRVNEVVRGWVGYFYYGNCTTAMSYLRQYLVWRIRIYLHRKHHYNGYGYKRFPDDYYYQALGFKIPRTAPWT